MSKQYRIGIDPGHGGKDPGAIGRVSKLEEEDVTLPIALELERLILQKDMLTQLTRRTDADISLITRSSLINNMKCDYAISIHTNSNSNTTPRYICTYIQATGGEAEKLAKKVQIRLVAATGWPDGGVKVSNLHMTRETIMPAILCECGFISNTVQEKQLADPLMQKKIATAIVNGLLDYLGIDQSTPLDDALEILVSKDVISGPDYWRTTAPTVKYLPELLVKVAEKMKEE